MAKKAEKQMETSLQQEQLFGEREDHAASGTSAAVGDDGAVRRKKHFSPKMAREEIRGIQDLLWKEALLALSQIESHAGDAGFQEYLQEHLPQNSLETRTRYAQSLMRWFFPDGVRGLVGQVLLSYRDQSMAAEMLRYLYLRAEPMVGAAVADALFPIAENAVIPGSYLTNFIRGRFGDNTPDKSIKRIKANLRKLGFLARGKGDKDMLRAMAPSATGFLVALHHVFALNEAGSVEFKRITDDCFWKYLGFKSEDRLRVILKESLGKGLIAKYLVADRIESIAFRYSFEEFVGRRMKA